MRLPREATLQHLIRRTLCGGFSMTPVALGEGGGAALITASDHVSLRQSVYQQNLILYMKIKKMTVCARCILKLPLDNDNVIHLKQVTATIS